MMQAMTSLSLSPSVVTSLSTPCDFLTRSQRFRRGESPNKRNNSTPSMPAQSCGAADVLATNAEITSPQASDLGHGCVRHVVVLVTVWTT